MKNGLQPTCLKQKLTHYWSGSWTVELFIRQIKDFGQGVVKRLKQI